MKQNQKTKPENKKANKLIVFVLLFSIVFGSISVPWKAQALWSESTIAANLIGQNFKIIIDNVLKIVLAALKKQALKSVTDKVKGALSGNGGSMIIADYEDFIYGTANDAAEGVVDDFFTSLNSGVTPEEREIFRSMEQQIKAELNGYSNIGGSLKNFVKSDSPIKDVFNDSAGGGINAYLNFQLGGHHPADIEQEVKAMAAAKMEQVMKAQETEAQAGQGFATKNTGNGKVVPGYILSEVTAASAKMPIDLLSNASSFQEVIVNLAMSTLQSTISQGYSVATDKLKSKTTGKMNSLLGSENKSGLQNVMKEINQGKGEKTNFQELYNKANNQGGGN